MAANPMTTRGDRPTPAPRRRELAHVLRRGGLIGADALIVLARAEGLSDLEIRNLVGRWEGRRWPSQ